MLWLNNGFIIVGNCEIALEIVLLWMERKSKRLKKTFKNNYDLQHTSFIWNGWCLRGFGIDCTLKSNCCTLTEVVTRIYDHNIVVETVRHGQPRYRNRSVCRFKTNVFGKFYHIRVHRLTQHLAKLENDEHSSTFRKFPESTRVVCRHLVVFGAEEELWSSKKLMGSWWCREL